MDVPLIVNPQTLPSQTRPLRIVLPGGSGQVGEMLARFFQEQGHQVTVLTRGPYTANWQTVHWDGEHEGSWIEHLEGADACINLSGRSINCRHNEANRLAIYESRIASTQLLGRVIARLNDPPKLWMNASAATLYQRTLDPTGVDLPLPETAALVCTEPSTDPDPWRPKRGFMQRVVRDWEAAFLAAETPRTRKIALRSAVTFSPVQGNVWAVLANLTRLGLGGKAGSGRQFMTWIHQADYARAVAFLMAHPEIDGPINLVAPNPLPNRAFMEALRYALDVPNGLPAPAFGIRIGAILMRTEAELVLDSCRAVPRRLLDAGFSFEFPDWLEAAEDLAGQWRHRHD